MAHVRQGYAMMIVLGLVVLLGVSLVILFESVQRNDQLVGRGHRELQDVLIGRSALSWTLAQLQDRPYLADGWRSDWVGGPDSSGFHVRLAMRGVFPRVEVTPVERSPALFGLEADIARVWIAGRKPSLVLWNSGDVVLVGNGRIEGDVVMDGRIRREAGDPRKRLHQRRISELPAWLVEGLDTSVVSAWQDVAFASFAGRLDSLDGWQLAPNTAQQGAVVLGPGAWIWSGPEVIDSLECRGCILLADRIRIRRGVGIDDGLLWVRRNLRMSGRVSGAGQFLATDTLDLDALIVDDPGCVFAAIGREQLEYDSVPTGRSTAMLRMKSTRGSGTILVYSNGRLSKEHRPVVETDSLTEWRGDVAIAGVASWEGTLDGTMFTEHFLSRRSDGVLQEGGFGGFLHQDDTASRVVLPWIGREPGLAGIRHWRYHALP